MTTDQLVWLIYFPSYLIQAINGTLYVQSYTSPFILSSARFVDTWGFLIMLYHNRFMGNIILPALCFYTIIDISLAKRQFIIGREFRNSVRFSAHCSNITVLYVGKCHADIVEPFIGDFAHSYYAVDTTRQLRDESRAVLSLWTSPVGRRICADIEDSRHKKLIGIDIEAPRYQT